MLFFKCSKIDGFSYEGIMAFLHFLYTDEVKVGESQVLGMIELCNFDNFNSWILKKRFNLNPMNGNDKCCSEMLRITHYFNEQSLMRACVENAIKLLCVQNVILFLKTAEELEMLNLVEGCMKLLVYSDI